MQTSLTTNDLGRDLSTHCKLYWVLNWDEMTLIETPQDVRLPREIFIWEWFVSSVYLQVNYPVNREYL